MPRRAYLLAFCLGLMAAVMVCRTAPAEDRPGAGNNPPPPQDRGGPGGPGGGGPRGRGGPPQGFHLLPPFAMEQLELSDDQKQQIATLEKETREKLNKILSADQQKKLDELRPPPRPGGRGGPGGAGGPGGPPPGGDGGGDGGGDRPPRPQRP